MSNLPPNPYSNLPGAPPTNANMGPQPQLFNQNPPLSQLPPGYRQKQDTNSNTPQHLPSSMPQNNFARQAPNVNHLNQSGSNSPAFNNSGVMPPVQTSLGSSPVRPPLKPVTPTGYQNSQQVPLSSASPQTVSNANPSPNPYPPNIPPQQRQINDNAPPLIASSQFQPVTNGPGSQPPSQYPVFSSAPQSVLPPNVNSAYRPTLGPQIPKGTGSPLPPVPQGPTSQANIPFSGPPQPGQMRRSPLISSPPVSGPPTSAPITNAPTAAPTNLPLGVNGPSGQPGRQPQGPTSAPNVGPPMARPPSGPPTGGSVHPPVSGSLGPGLPPNQMFPGPNLNGPSGSTQPARPPGSFPPGSFPAPNQLPIQGPPSGPQGLPPTSLQSLPPTSLHQQPGLPKMPPGPQGPLNMQPGPTNMAPGPYNMQPGPPNMPPGPPNMQSGPLGPPNVQPGLHNMPPGPNMQPRPVMPPGPVMQSGPNMPPGMPPMPGPQSTSGVPPGPPKSNMQNRYPQMPQSNLNNQPMMPPQPNMAQPTMNRQYAQPQYNAQQYNTQGITQQMGQLSVTKQGFDQLWGHQMIDLLQCTNILPEYAEEPPEIRLGHQFAESSNCSPEIFRCTINRIPETNSLLQKSRLPLGILIHPFKDLNHLPVIQCSTIVRCRACRTYINPFVYFVDAKRWKCNLCYRVNDLPEEFQYDPVSKSYGDPTRRPEIKSATIEFIAPGEYMLRPPQPAVYLFLFDVSQIAMDSGYLHVVCETLKNNLDQLPGDARTQVGFVCYDSHVHYYLMGEGLTRPKEMTVLDIDDIFLPSPESLLVNLGERKELVKELLSVLGARRSAGAAGPSALGAALQAGYKLMAPTGGRITVFQTCLPTIGPGRLESREDPNARSSKDVAHLKPATDFYKRIALDCSGAQVAVDLFLLSSQYSDLATLSGMSKFSGGTVYHIPLFKASRSWQAATLERMLTRYLTRKIGFEAVMRVRCTRGISIHTFHGNFFVRSTDLLSLPNVSPDAGFGMQLAIEESLSDLQQVCFQAALLYTSSKGERRIRVHTLALPIANTLTDVLHSADQMCIIGLLSKMAVDRCVDASMSEAREALINVAIDALSAHRLSQNLPAGSVSSALHAPASLRLLPLLLLALLKRKAFRTGTSTRLDDRVADMCDIKSLPLPQLIRAAYPPLYPLHELSNMREEDPMLPQLMLSAQRINSSGCYLLDDLDTMIIYVCHNVSPAYLSETFGVAAFSQLPDEARSLPAIETDANEALHAFIEKLNEDRPYESGILVLRDNSPSRHLFIERLVDDRMESSFSYYEFLQHVKQQVK
ncbi:protein transport protein Sec24A [Leguminivora glycinivorella]|uniref:protein transport protein Sec24A n=1 Tax=Leguminivora glycinivorella TaxID=1035111 RepID=UPI00200E9B2A|nr:protein transport protein Sec24A [Leguminivora glycinivorella]XP_047985974.1 protein transport protein Sec24A [Leguminivora glycinivorella]